MASCCVMKLAGEPTEVMFVGVSTTLFAVGSAAVVFMRDQLFYWMDFRCVLCYFLSHLYTNLNLTSYFGYTLSQLVFRLIICF